MGKRKREADEPKEDVTSLLAKRIAIGKHELAKALKQAQRFERQKLGRVQKIGKRKTRDRGKKERELDPAKVLAEIEVLKKLDFKKLAERRFYKDLVKTKSIHGTGLLPAEVTLPATAGMDTTTGTVISRLFTQQPVKDAIEAAMQSVRSTLGVEAGPSKGSKRAKPSEEHEVEESVKKKSKKEQGKESIAGKEVAKESATSEQKPVPVTAVSRKAVDSEQADALKAEEKAAKKKAKKEKIKRQKAERQEIRSKEAAGDVELDKDIRLVSKEPQQKVDVQVSSGTVEKNAKKEKARTKDVAPEVALSKEISVKPKKLEKEVGGQDPEQVAKRGPKVERARSEVLSWIESVEEVPAKQVLKKEKRIGASATGNRETAQSITDRSMASVANTKSKELKSQPEADSRSAVADTHPKRSQKIKPEKLQADRASVDILTKTKPATTKSIKSEPIGTNMQSDFQSQQANQKEQSAISSRIQERNLPKPAPTKLSIKRELDSDGDSEMEDEPVSFFDSTIAKEMLANRMAEKSRKSLSIQGGSAKQGSVSVSESDAYNGHNQPFSEPDVEMEDQDEKASESEEEDDEVEEMDESDYDSDNLEPFDERVAPASEDDDSQLDTPSVRAKMAMALRDELVSTDELIDQPPLAPRDGASVSLPKAASRSGTPVPAQDSVALSSDARQIRKPVVARRMILHHLGLRDPDRPKRQIQIEENGPVVDADPLFTETSLLNAPAAFADQAEASVPEERSVLNSLEASLEQAEASMLEKPSLEVSGSVVHNDSDSNTSSAYHTPQEGVSPRLPDHDQARLSGTKALSQPAQPEDETSEPEAPTQLEEESASGSSDATTSEAASKSDASSSSGEASDAAPAFSMKTAKSAFLPSLTMGGYWSGGSEEASDLEDTMAPKKNRRGQKARQKIWEKKFKDNAKHLKSKVKKNTRDQGWDAQRGATDGKEVKGRGGRVKPDWRQKGPSGANDAPLGTRKTAAEIAHKDDVGKLHPSWMAKKVLKGMDAGIGGFKGKKITFD